MAARDWRVWALKATVAVGGALPAVSLWWRLPQAVNPVEFLTRGTGTWALVGLLATLAVSPLRQLSGWAAWLRVRRLLGLSAFAYAVAHFVLYVWLDQGLEAAAIWRDVLKRPFVTAGMAAFVLLIPLAITSTDGWMRRLKRRWGLLHRLVYPAAMLAVLHDLWLVKKDLTQPLIYAAVLAFLLGWRLWRRWHTAFHWHSPERK
jgi:sulfoxide reductase heme-binding subunit YedZ